MGVRAIVPSSVAALLCSSLRSSQSLLSGQSPLSQADSALSDRANQLSSHGCNKQKPEAHADPNAILLSPVHPKIRHSIWVSMSMSFQFEARRIHPLGQSANGVRRTSLRKATKEAEPCMTSSAPVSTGLQLTVLSDRHFLYSLTVLSDAHLTGRNSANL